MIYDYLINDALLEAGDIVTGNADRNAFIGTIGVKPKFLNCLRPLARVLRVNLLSHTALTHGDGR